MVHNETANSKDVQNPPEGGYDAPSSGRLGGRDGQFSEELNAPDAEAAQDKGSDEFPLEAPSTDAPLTDETAGPTSAERESFSSESDDDASGAPL